MSLVLYFIHLSGCSRIKKEFVDHVENSCFEKLPLNIFN